MPHRGIRVLFVVDLAVVPADRRPAELAQLAEALHREFPAFRLAQWIAADDAAAVVVATGASTPAHALERLDGWGHGRLILGVRSASWPARRSPSSAGSST